MQTARKRARNPHGEGDHLRQELIEAAGRVLATAPTGGDLSLRAVAREAGVAAPSVYLQFTDKADLVRAVLQHYFEQLRAAIQEAADQGQTAADRLRAGCIAYCRFGLEHPGPYHVLFQFEPADPAYLTSFGVPDDAGARALATLVDAIAACHAAGVARPADPFHQAAMVWSAMHGYVSLIQVRPGFPWQPVEDHVEALLVGLVGVPRQGSEPGASRPASSGDPSIDGASREQGT